MEYRTLGNSSLIISRIGFGGMSLEDGGEKLLLAALEKGINYFDTADIYQHGLNEEMIGRAFHVRRNEVILATKAGNERTIDGKGWHWNPGRNHLLTALESSLRRLNTDYVDLFQLHGGMLEDPIDEIIGTFELLQQQGKIRYYGISSIRPEVIREYVRRSSIASVMMQYCLLDRRPEEELLDLLQENRIGVLARGSLAKGMLVSKAPAQFLNHATADVMAMAGQVAAISDDERTATGTALQFVLGHPAVTSSVVGMRTPQQLDAAIAAERSRGLSKTEYHHLANVLSANQYTEFR